MPIICPKCETPSPDNSNFCNRCGTALVQPKEVARPRKGVERKPRSRGCRNFLMIGVAILVVGCLASAFAMMLTSTPSYRATATAETIARLTEEARPTNTIIPTRTPPPTSTLVPETATAYAIETQAAERQTATAVAQIQQQETATAEAHAQAAAEATEAIEAYRGKAPKGTWIDSDDGVGVAVGDFRYAQTTNLYDSGQGAKFVAFGIVIVNKSGGAISVNPHDVTLVDLDGYTYSYDVATYDYWSIPLDAVEVQDGNQVQGGLVFKIRQKTGPAQVIFETGLFFTTEVVVDLRRPPDEAD